MGNTHGVSKAKKPPRKPRMIRSIKLFPDETIFEDLSSRYSVFLRLIKRGLASLGFNFDKSSFIMLTDDPSKLNSKSDSLKIQTESSMIISHPLKKLHLAKTLKKSLIKETNNPDWYGYKRIDKIKKKEYFN